MQYNNELEYHESIYSLEPREKPVVHYSVLWSDVEIGYSATLTPVNHPATYLNNYPCIYTSYVVSYDKETGRIETRNTIYLPLEK